MRILDKLKINDVAIHPKRKKPAPLKEYFRLFWNRVVFSRPILGIISHQSKTIYFPTTKTASTAIKRLLGEIENKTVEGNPHYDLNFDSTEYSELGNYSDYTSFTVMRDPLDRLYSCYDDKIKDKYQYTNGISHGFKRYNRFARREIFSSDMSFESFVNIITKIPDRFAEAHFRSQHKFITGPDQKIIVDRILRFENLEAGLKEMFDPTYVDKIFSRSRNTKNYHHYYDDTMLKKVKRRFKRDFEIYQSLK